MYICMNYLSRLLISAGAEIGIRKADVRGVRLGIKRIGSSTVIASRFVKVLKSAFEEVVLLEAVDP